MELREMCARLTFDELILGAHVKLIGTHNTVDARNENDHHP